jgi:hypothetical protein
LWLNLIRSRVVYTAEKTIEPCPKITENVMDLMVIMGIVLVLMVSITVSAGI